MANMSIEIKAQDVFDIKGLKRDIQMCNSAVKGLLFINFITFGFFKDRFEYQAEILYDKLIESINSGAYKK